PEIADRRNLGDGPAWPETGSIHVGDRVFGDLLLLFAGIEDRRAVAGAYIVALPVLRARVVDLEEEFQKVPVAGLLRVEDDLDRLGMGAMVTVGRVLDVAAAIADARRDHARKAADEILHAPEASTRQDGTFFAHWKSSRLAETTEAFSQIWLNAFLRPRWAF